MTEEWWREWRISRTAPPGPYRPARWGRVWAVADAAGRANCASGPQGRVFLATEEDARALADHFNSGDAEVI